jgi:DNA-binding MarR family transcriptional regulator
MLNDVSESPAEPLHDDQGFLEEVDSVMRAAQVLVAVIAQSAAEIEDVVTLPQFRVLVMAATRGALNLRAVAAGLGVHPSNATRVCDRLVAGGLLDRRDDPADRRHLILTLTDKGRQLFDSVIQHRRAAIGTILAQMPPSNRRTLAADLQAFADAAGETPQAESSPLGWTT